MTLLHNLRKTARKFGIEVHRYNIAHSLDARLLALIQHHSVETVVDVGANDGGYGDFLRQGGYTGRILSFEPLKAAHTALLARAEADQAWAIAERCALGDAPGTLDIHVAGNSTSSSLLPMLQSHVDAAPHSASVATEPVPVYRLDDFDHSYLRSGKKILLKIDTQGYELPVLRGATNTLVNCIGVQIEMSIVPLYAGQALYRELIDFLDVAGFDLWGLLPGFVDPASGRLLQMDGIFFKR